MAAVMLHSCAISIHRVLFIGNDGMCLLLRLPIPLPNPLVATILLSLSFSLFWPKYGIYVESYGVLRVTAYFT